MRNSSLLRIWIIFGVVMVLGIVLLVNTFAGSRNPDQLTEEDIYNITEEADGEEVNFDELTEGGATTVEDWVNTGTSTVASGTFSAASGVKGFFMRLFALREIDAEYVSLKERIIQLELERSFYEELQQENERLLKLLGFAEEYPEYVYVNAEIIASDSNSWFMEFTINRGEKHGIILNSAVVNEDGLVGRVIEVYPNTSKVITIIDTQSSVPVVAERSRDNGVASGAVDPYTSKPEIRMQYLLSDADLVPGDTVLSSSLMGIFPKGIEVGEIKEVVRENSSENYAVITPTVDFSHLENLLVIVGTSEDATEVDTVSAEEIEDSSETDEGDNQ